MSSCGARDFSCGYSGVYTLRYFRIEVRLRCWHTVAYGLLLCIEVAPTAVFPFAASIVFRYTRTRVWGILIESVDAVSSVVWNITEIGFCVLNV